MNTDLRTISFFTGLLKDLTGQEISLEKSYFVENNLELLLPEFELKNICDFATVIKETRNPKMIQRVIDVLSIHETSFYRDRKVYQSLRNDVLPYLIEQKSYSKSMKVLFTACSSGQEVYTFAMMLDELRESIKQYQISLVGTDVSQGVLDKAQKGVYTQFEIQRGLPVQNMLKYFEKMGPEWRVKDEIRKNIRFEILNLIQPWPTMERFDLVFCRNVLIYMNLEVRKHILSEIYKIMPPDGLLVIGSTETLLNVTDKFVAYPGVCGIYKKV